MINILMFGPPGSGKGTQSVTLAGKYNLLHLSTGDMLRAELAAGTPLGKKMEAIMAAGYLVPDDVVIAMIAQKIDATTGKPVSSLTASPAPWNRPKHSRRCWKGEA
jgi:adenylate kinase